MDFKDLKSKVPKLDKKTYTSSERTVFLIHFDNIVSQLTSDSESLLCNWMLFQALGLKGPPQSSRTFKPVFLIVSDTKSSPLTILTLWTSHYEDTQATKWATVRRI
jgi:hypothetical protein